MQPLCNYLSLIGTGTSVAIDVLVLDSTRNVKVVVGALACAVAVTAMPLKVELSCETVTVAAVNSFTVHRLSGSFGTGNTLMLKSPWLTTKTENGTATSCPPAGTRTVVPSQFAFCCVKAT